MRYHTFDLTASATGAPHEYLLSAQSSTQGEAEGRTNIDPSSVPLADLLAALGYGTISSANLQVLGATLYQSLFAGEIGMLLNCALGETIGNEALGLRLRLRINPPELAARSISSARTKNSRRIANGCCSFFRLWKSKKVGRRCSRRCGRCGLAFRLQVKENKVMAGVAACPFFCLYFDKPNLGFTNLP
jgi:hypothetical protein